MTDSSGTSKDSSILADLRRADARGVVPPQNWTTRAADEIERLRAALTEYGVHGSSCEPDNCVCGLRELLNGYGIETGGKS